MTQASIRLIALDMDGTITQHKTPLESANREALSSADGGRRRVHAHFPSDGGGSH